ncbi:MAG: CIA30 family protein [Gemmataceae bacterium]|nr:CIA30 family protein [Gemmataceae bacterium]
MFKYSNIINSGIKSTMKASTIILILILGGFNIMAEDKDRLVFNFNTPESGKIWVSVNDNVMGGISEGKLKITQDKTLFFYGSLSLANNGGFASIRCLPTQLGLKKNDSIYFQAKGDGREYTMNLYTNKRLTAFSYRQSFQTKNNEWVEISLPLEKFISTSFGKVIPKAEPINPTNIESLGFMLGDKKPGAFQVEFKDIKAKSK